MKNFSNFPNYREHLSEEFTRYDYKMCKIFIVGEDCLLNTNEIFKIIIIYSKILYKI